MHDNLHRAPYLFRATTRAFLLLALPAAIALRIPAAPMDREFEEPTVLRDVAAFHRLFKVPVLNQPTIPDKQRCALRVNLLQEELNELQAAIEQKDIIEVADALADLQYVLAGAVHEFGLATRFAALHNEVHRSNMSKACQTREEAERTVAHYAAKEQPAMISEVDGVFLVYRTDDNKVLKSVEYSPARLSEIVGTTRTQGSE